MKTFKNIIKKILVLGTSFCFLGATVLGATSSIDLSNYPSPFITDGKFDAKIVIGEAAKTTDVIGAIDIASNLQYSMVQEVPISKSSTTTLLLGDVKEIQPDINEQLDNVKSVITSSDLMVLEDGEFRNRYGDAEYTQTIEVAEAKAVFAIDADAEGNLEDVPAEYLMFPANTKVYTYTISFSPAIKAEHSDGSLKGLESQQINLLGKDYMITQAKHSTKDIELTLMGGATRDIIDEGATKTYTLFGKDYEITATAITTDEVQFVINNELTPTLEEGETYKTESGAEIGIINIQENEAAELFPDRVEFTLGAQKIKISDDDTSNSLFDGTVTVGSEELDQVGADITTSLDEGTANGADVKISSIKIRYKPSENLYLPKGNITLSEVADKKEDQIGNLFTGQFDMVFGGFDEVNTEAIALKSDGEENYKLAWMNKNGQKYNTDVLYLDVATVLLGKEADEKLIVNEAQNIRSGDHFILSKNGYSHLMKVREIKSDKVTVRDDASGGVSYELLYSGGVGTTADLNVDGNTFKIKLVDDAGTKKIQADMNGDGDYTDIVNSLETKYEGIITLAGGNTERAVEFTTEDGQTTNTTIKIIENELRIGSVDNSKWTFPEVRVEDSDEYQFYNSPYGEKGIWNKDNQGTFTWLHPVEQVKTKVYYKSGLTSEQTITEGGLTAQKIVKIEVGQAVLDTSISDYKGQNLIVVGGPAINRAAAILLGKPYPSYGADSGIPENMAIIKLIQNGDNVAMVVAGWEAADTQRACIVVADNTKYAGFKGTEIKVTGTSLTDITVNEVVQNELTGEGTK